MTEYLNKLVIIGNGFDLAHGLKTSYSDFIEWYICKMFENTEDGNCYNYQDKIICVEFNLTYRLNYKNINLDWFIQRRKEGLFYKITKISPFLEILLNKSYECSWVDIESEFYKRLIYVYNQCLNTNDYKWKISEINELNTEIEFIKDKLAEYLKTINCKESNREFSELFYSNFSRGYLKKAKNKQVHYLNFNYTNTIEKYIHPQSNYQLNYIHGKLNIKDNPLIFGYGDEIDSYYEKIEHLNINEFLNNFKSFGYFKTGNYENLLRFIDSEPYDIEILGHSCGLSDRVLLNTIFEHDNCKKIKIHYYQKSETENDFITKTQEISRHFKDKAKMRARIVNFKECNPLVKYKPNK